MGTMRLLATLALVGCSIGCSHPCEDMQAAAMSGDLAALERSAAAGTDVGCSTGERWQPIHYAARAGQSRAVDWLLGHGARIEAFGELGRTPIYEAAKYGQVSTVTSLLARGADVDARSETEATPLIVAAERRHRAVMELLLQHGADVNAVDNRGTTPLAQLIKFAGPDDDADASAGVQLLIAHGAWLDVHERTGWTPLHLAARNGLVGVATLLFDAGANPSPFRTGHLLPQAYRGLRDDEMQPLLDAHSIWPQSEIIHAAGPEAPITLGATVVGRSGEHAPALGARCEMTLSGGVSGTLTCRIDAHCGEDVLYAGFARCEETEGQWRGVDPWGTSEDRDPTMIVDLTRHVLVIDDCVPAPEGRSTRLQLDGDPAP